MVRVWLFGTVTSSSVSLQSLLVINGTNSKLQGKWCTGWFSVWMWHWYNVKVIRVMRWLRCPTLPHLSLFSHILTRDSVQLFNFYSTWNSKTWTNMGIKLGKYSAEVCTLLGKMKMTKITFIRFHRWILYVFFVSVWVFSEFSISSQLPKTCHYGWIGHFKLPFGLNVCVNVCWKTVCA